MVSWAKSVAPRDYPQLSDLTAKRICELACSGDELARKAVERETRYLGLGVANLVTMFAPEAIVLGGSVMKSASLFLDGIRKCVHQSCTLVPAEKTEICLASLGDDSNLIGAARVWHYRFTAGGEQHAR